MDSYLQHHGVKGQKWGVRRTPEQLGHAPKKSTKRKLSLFNRNKKKTVKKTTKKSTEESSTKKKSVKEMNDDELRDKVNRLRMEKEVLNLQREISSLTPKQVSPGKNFVTKVGKDILLPTIEKNVKAYATKQLDNYLKNKLGLKEPVDAFKQLQKEVEELKLKKTKTEINDYFKKRKKKQEQEQQEQENNTNTNTNTNNRTNSTEKWSGTVEGTGTSRYEKESGPVYDAYYRDVSRKQAQSNRYAEIGMNHVAGLLGYKKEDD